MKSVERIYDDIRYERERQEDMWGNTLDNKNTINDWVTYITKYCGEAAFATTKHDQYNMMVMVAALAVAALEAYKRNGEFPPRHYDK